jgi:DUF438 domain-containing protein
MDYRERIEVKVGILFQAVDQYLSEQISMEEAKERISIEMASIRPAQFEAVKRELEKRLKRSGDGTASQKLFQLFGNYLTPPYHKLREGHPLRNYSEEAAYARSVLLQIDEREEEETPEEEWQRLYELLRGFSVHIIRQEKNFYPLLTAKGLGPQVERAKELGSQASKALAENRVRLENGVLIDFLYYQRSLSKTYSKYLDLEERTLYIRGLSLLSSDDFATLRKKDDEEGYAYIEQPVEFIPEENSWIGVGSPTDDALIKSSDYSGDPVPNIPVQIKSLLLQRNGDPLHYDIKEGGRTYRVTYSLLDEPDAQVGADQNIAELFRTYPRFQEDFFRLDEELVSLKGPFGMELLNDSTVEMMAKSLRIDTNNFLDRINQLLKSY